MADLFKVFVILVVINLSISLLTGIQNTRLSSTEIGETISVSLGTQGNSASILDMIKNLALPGSVVINPEEGTASAEEAKTELEQEYKGLGQVNGLSLNLIDVFWKFAEAIGKAFDLLGAIVWLTVLVSAKLASIQSLWMLVFTLPLNIAQIAILLKLMMTSMRI